MPECEPTCTTVKKILNQRQREGPKAKQISSEEKPIGGSGRELNEDSATKWRSVKSSGESLETKESFGGCPSKNSSRVLGRDLEARQRSREDPGMSTKRKLNHSLEKYLVSENEVVPGGISDFEEQELGSDDKIPIEAHYNKDTEINEGKNSSKASSKTSSLGKSLNSKVSKGSSRKVTLDSAVNNNYVRSSDSKNDKIVEVVSSDEESIESVQREKKQRGDNKSEGSAAESSECSVISESYENVTGTWDQRKQFRCSSGCLLGKSKEQFRKRTEEEQETLDRYVLNKGFNYFKDMCPCSYSCLYHQIVNDSFIKSTFTSAVLFMLGIKLCSELNAWYLPSDVLY